MSDELKACPFCGSADYRTGNGTVMPHKNRAPKLGHDRYHYAIRCGSCGFNGPRGLNDKQAVEGWNRRAPVDALAGGVPDGVMVPREPLVGVIARGWCHPLNVRKQMDADLVLAIKLEVEKWLAAPTEQESK